jgi:hypothetical protein
MSAGPELPPPSSKLSLSSPPAPILFLLPQQQANGTHMQQQHTQHLAACVLV